MRRPVPLLLFGLAAACTLPHSGLEVRMPDCARLHADGTNEVAHIVPDVAAEWHTDDDAPGRAAAALAAVRRARATSP